MRRGILGLFVLLAASVADAGVVSSFNDIQYWVGNGQNRAALVIDWAGDSSTDQSWVWGFRWDGAATGEDMLQAIVAADPALYERVGPRHAVYGLPLYGLGYDLNHNGVFGISDETAFSPTTGIATTGVHDGAVATDSGDLYKEGWDTGFWNYGISVGGNPFGAGHWGPSDVGMSVTTLADGDWNGFAYETDWAFNSYPANPYAAVVPEPSTLILAVVAGLIAVTFRRRRKKQ
ncbi:MAG: PEP-CTERM sorting domain-containing protein [Planctomycetaceae bacterium]|nr:PEP-CTERM sorting domain-containing protein [Planctomycetaceae bacterium]